MIKLENISKSYVKGKKSVDSFKLGNKRWRDFWFFRYQMVQEKQHY